MKSNNGDFNVLFLKMSYLNYSGWQVGKYFSVCSLLKIVAARFFSQKPASSNRDKPANEMDKCEQPNV
jgi:hypothetical protein